MLHIFTFTLIVYALSVLFCAELLLIIYSPKGKYYNEIEYVNNTVFLTWFPVLNTLYVIFIWVFINPYNITYRKGKKNLKVVRKLLKTYLELNSNASITFKEMLALNGFTPEKIHSIYCFISDLSGKEDSDILTTKERVSILHSTIFVFKHRYL